MSIIGITWGENQGVRVGEIRKKFFTVLENVTPCSRVCEILQQLLLAFFLLLLLLYIHLFSLSS